MQRIIESGRHSWCTHPVDDIRLLVDAHDYYREFHRVASMARRYLLLAGWQFDSDVALLRGGEEEQVEGPVTLLKFLNHLCDKNPELEIFILAWDFHAVFAIEREWLQNIVFEWSHKRIHFRFDSSHVEQGCHHQKFVVVDGELSFLGGLDLCDHRWDDHQHKNKNPLRTSRGAPHKPFHDVQAYLRGREIARSIGELFTYRWQRAGGDPITLPELLDRGGAALVPTLSPPMLPPMLTDYQPESGIALAAGEVVLSRTDPHGSPNGAENCTEIRDLYLDAIHAAERFIYIETQYFSSHVIGDAIERRMGAEGRSLLEIVLILNKEAETAKEQLAVGFAQAKVLSGLRAAAAATGHHLGIYYTLPGCEEDEEPERATYIHSKLMIVDDRFLTVGSANLTNRSLTVDTELNASVETERPDSALGRSIYGVRAALLDEHLGAPNLDDIDGLVARLDALASPPESSSRLRLRLHPSPTPDERAVLEVIDPQQLPFDPDAVENIDDDEGSIFVGGIGAVWRRLFSDRDGTVKPLM